MSFSTFSIVARDPKSGEMAVAGGTNWFNYGRWVPHAMAGIGAIATQAETNMWYAKAGLEKLQTGKSAEETVTEVMQEQPDEEGIYQLLVMDKKGKVECHTGARNHNYAGHFTQDNFGVAGNTLVSEGTIKAVADYYNSSQEEFAIKIIKALQAGQKAGGDLRGMKSAAIKIVKSESTGEDWNDTLVDLRVDENTDPLKELERLYKVGTAYKYIGQAEEADKPEDALALYEKALTFDPTNSEIKFWIAWSYKLLDNEQKVKELLNKLGPNWQEYWKRLEKRG